MSEIIRVVQELLLGAICSQQDRRYPERDEAFRIVLADVMRRRNNPPHTDS